MEYFPVASTYAKGRHAATKRAVPGLQNLSFCIVVSRGTLVPPRMIMTLCWKMENGLFGAHDLQGSSGRIYDLLSPLGQGKPLRLLFPCPIEWSDTQSSPLGRFEPLGLFVPKTRFIQDHLCENFLIVTLR